MKKPTGSRRKKSGSSSSDSTTTAGTAAASSSSSVSGKKEDHGFLSKYKKQLDPCHNLQIPSCVILQDVMREVFPEVRPAQSLRQENKQPQKKEEEDDVDIDEKTSTKSTQSSRKQQRSQTLVETSVVGGASSHPYYEQSHQSYNGFNQLLRRRYIWLRQDAQGKGLSRREETCKNGRKKDGNTEALDVPQQTVSSASKNKKKKRKKKQKKEGNNGDRDDTGGLLVVDVDVADSDAAPYPFVGDKEDSTNISVKDISGTEQRVVHNTDQTVDSHDNFSTLFQSDLTPEIRDDAQPTLTITHSSSSVEATASCRLTATGVAVTSRQSRVGAARDLFFEWIDQVFLTCPENGNGKNSHDIQENGKELPVEPFIDFCQQRTFGGTELKGIPLIDLISVTEKIGCVHCRINALEAIEKLLKRIDPESPSSSVATVDVALKQSYLADPKQESVSEIANDVDEAFAYQELSALEEGNPLVQRHKNGTIDEDDEDDAGNVTNGSPTFDLVFVLTRNRNPKHSRTNNNGEQSKERTLAEKGVKYEMIPKALTTDSFDSFLQNWLVLGIDDDALVDTALTSSSKVSQSSEPVQITQNELEAYKASITMDLEDYCSNRLNSDFEDRLLGEINSVNHAISSEGNLHLTAFYVLQQCDQFCNRYVSEELLGILNFAGDAPNRPDLEIEPWRVLLDALAAASKRCVDYYQILEKDLTDQNGSIQPVFVNASVRKLYGDVIKDKILLMTEAGDEIKKYLDRASTKERLTKLVWLGKKANLENETIVDIGDECTTLVEKLIDWTNVIQGNRMSEIRRIQRKKREDVRTDILDIYEKLLVLQEELKTDCDAAHYEEIEAHGERARRANESMVLDVASEVEKVFDAATGLILLWRCIRVAWFKKVTRGAPKLPIPLQRWILESHFPIDELWGNHCNKATCGQGLGGKRRIRCILAGLMHQWLSERHNEWKSETATRELLTVVESELAIPPNGSNGGVGKLSKKSKKKKKPTQIVIGGKEQTQDPGKPEPISNGIVIASPVGSIEGVNSSEDIVTESTKEPQDEIQADRSWESDLENFTLVSNQSVKPKNVSRKELEEVDVGGELGPVDAEWNDHDEHVDMICRSTIVVECEGELISAKDYLLERFFEVMKVAKAGDASIIISTGVSK